MISFIVIYALIFFGGWKLFEASDPILLEIAASIVIGFILWLFYEVISLIQNRITELEKRVIELENTQMKK